MNRRRHHRSDLAMRPTHRRRQRIALAATAFLFTTVPAWHPADAAVRTWIGGNSTWTDSTTDNAKFSGADEPDPDDDLIIDTANTIDLASNNTILTLTMSGSADLDANAFDLTVDGLTSLTGAGTTFTLPTNSALTTDNFTASTSAQLILAGGQLTLIEETGNGVITLTGGTLIGHGTVQMSDALAAVTTLFNNNGTLTANTPSLLLVPPAAGTLTINATNANARINLDGSGEAGVVNVNRNQTLDINVQLADTFNGDINLGHNSTLSIEDPWTFGTGATLDANNGASGGFPAIPADTSFISGGTMTQSGGTITVLDADGTLQFNAPFSMTGGDLVNNGLVVFNANATIAAGANFTMPGTSASLTVNPGVSVVVNQGNFNADGSGTSTNVLTVNSGGLLDLNLTVADDALQGTINLNGGTLSVTTTDDTWSILNDLNTGADSGISILSGEELTLSSPAVTVGANSTLRLSAVTNFSGGSYGGTGTLQVQSSSNVIANTTVATTSFDWDGTGIGTPHTIANAVTFTINSANFDTDGDMDDPLTIGSNSSTLTVNGPASWTMEGALTTNTADTGVAIIGGTSRMVLGGTFTVSGDTNITAPVTFGAGNTTTVAAAAILTVSGNTVFSGGTVAGAGTYDPASANSVTANSTITVTNFNFDANGAAAWTVDPGATLTVNVGTYDTFATKLYEGSITLNSGSASVTSGEAEFIMDGTLNLNNTTGTVPVWSGEPIDFGDDADVLDSNLNVGGTGVSVIDAQVDFNSDADVNIAAGATLVLTNTAIFLPVNLPNNAEFTGAGTFVIEGTAVFSEATTLNMTGGTVDLDGRAGDDTGNFVFIQAPLTINAATLNSFGKTNGVGGPNTLDINHNGILTGELIVNLDAAASEWTLNSTGVINFFNDNTSDTLLAGSAVNVNGTLNVTGDVRSDARLDFGSTAVVNINTANEPFRLSGGTLATPNTIAGATVNGPGLLGADADTALRGFGTINPNVDFDSTAQLRADNGTLTLNGTLVDVGIVGTADADGTLALTNPQTLLASMTMELLGGNVTGAALTNQGLIRGNGTVANNTTNAATGIIRGAPLGTLLFTGINGANAGRIELNGGTVEFNNALTNAPTGVIAGFGTLRANSNLTNQGSIQVPAGGPTNFFGAITSANASTIIIAANGAPTFDSNVNLQAGATLTAAAGSVNRFLAALTVNGTVTLAPNVSGTSIASLTINAGGSFDLANNRVLIDYAGASPIATIRGYILSARLNSSTAAADVDNRLTIGYAENSLLGLADWSGLPTDATSLLLRMTYFGDANLNGQVDRDDFVRIDRAVALGLPAIWSNGDFNHSGTITSADYMLIDRVFHQQTGVLPSPEFLAMRLSQFGPEYVAALVASIPEPSSTLACLAAALPLACRRRRAK